MSQSTQPVLTAPTEHELFNLEAAMQHTIRRNHGYLQQEMNNYIEMVRLKRFLAEKGLEGEYHLWMGKKFEAHS